MQATFSQVAGPMTAAIAALGNSVVLHSLDKTTSLFMHVRPAHINPICLGLRMPSLLAGCRGQATKVLLLVCPCQMLIDASLPSAEWLKT